MLKDLKTQLKGDISAMKADLEGKIATVDR
mgnify:CR=1 FL=1